MVKCVITLNYEIQIFKFYFFKYHHIVQIQSDQLQ